LASEVGHLVDDPRGTPKSSFTHSIRTFGMS